MKPLLCTKTTRQSPSNKNITKSFHRVMNKHHYLHTTKNRWPPNSKHNPLKIWWASQFIPAIYFHNTILHWRKHKPTNLKKTTSKVQCILFFYLFYTKDGGESWSNLEPYISFRLLWRRKVESESAIGFLGGNIPSLGEWFVVRRYEGFVLECTESDCKFFERTINIISS